MSVPQSWKYPRQGKAGLTYRDHAHHSNHHYALYFQIFQENSDVNFEVRDAITFTLLNYLMDGIIDVSVVRTPIKLEGLNYLELSEEPMIAVLPPAFPENGTKKRASALRN